MFSTIAAYLLVAAHVLFPPYLLYRLWRLRFRTIRGWGIEVGFTLLALGMLFVIGRWDVVRHPLRYWICGAGLIGAVLSFLRVYDAPLSTEHGIRWRWGAAIEGVVLGGLLLWGLAGTTPERPTVSLTAPLQGSSYYVAHGGATPPINYHGAFAESQTYALDLNQLNEWGSRATGIQPRALSRYAVFADTVHSPLTGTVVEAVDSLPDQNPPDRHPRRPTGNHIWLRRDSLYVVLAHLKQRSVRVRAGQHVEAGQPLARVGNTGNTTEPHLHLHAVTYPGGRAPTTDSLSQGDPVPVTIDGRFLTRNDLLRAR